LTGSTNSPTNKKVIKKSQGLALSFLGMKTVIHKTNYKYMKKITAFNFITLNGFLNDVDGDISWHRHGVEENQFAAESLQSGNTLLFGRNTYEMMAGYWPTPMAMQNDPDVAE
jgi:hypothetical protein